LVLAKNLRDNDYLEMAATSMLPEQGDDMSDEQKADKPKSKFTNRGGHGGPPGNSNAKKHGYYSLVKLIRNRRGALDKRTILGKMVIQTVQDLESDLGGDLSTAQRLLVADVALDTLLLQALNNTVADSKPLIEGKNGLTAHPVYQLRSQLITQRREHLKLLYPAGLRRVAKTLSVTDLLNGSGEPEGSGEGDAR
jgi:hypothetical protein